MTKDEWMQFLGGERLWNMFQNEFHYTILALLQYPLLSFSLKHELTPQPPLLFPLSRHALNNVVHPDDHLGGFRAGEQNLLLHPEALGDAAHLHVADVPC